MDRTRKESLLERYWRLRGEADELYQRQMRKTKINEEMRKSVQRELDALEYAIERTDLVEVLRHKLILEVLLGTQVTFSRARILRTKDGKRETAKLVGTVIGATIVKNLDYTREGDASK